MNILVIEDNEYKFKQIEKSLNRLLKDPNIVWMDSRNAGLVSFQVRNVRIKNNPYHIVITDNYLPLYSVDDDNMFERDEDIQPFAADIVSEIRRLGFEELPIIVCSSEDIEECDYNYFIKYDPSVSLDEIFKTIFSDIAAYQIIQEQTKDCRTCQNMSCRVENSEKPVKDCFGYINHEKEEQGPVKKLVQNKKK